VRTCVARIAREKVGIEPIRNHGGGGDNTMYMIASAEKVRRKIKGHPPCIIYYSTHAKSHDSVFLLCEPLEWALW